MSHISEDESVFLPGPGRKSSAAFAMLCLAMPGLLLLSSISASAPLIMVSPVAETVYQFGDVLTVSWSYDAGKPVLIYISTDNGLSFPLTISGDQAPVTPASGKGTFNWTIPVDERYMSDSVIIQIMDYSVHSVQADSPRLTIVEQCTGPCNTAIRAPAPVMRHAGFSIEGAKIRFTGCAKARSAGVRIVSLDGKSLSLPGQAMAWDLSNLHPAVYEVIMVSSVTGTMTRKLVIGR